MEMCEACRNYRGVDARFKDQAIGNAPRYSRKQKGMIERSHCTVCPKGVEKERFYHMRWYPNSHFIPADPELRVILHHMLEYSLD
jgi:hypothetical protein